MDTFFEDPGDISADWPVCPICGQELAYYTGDTYTDTAPFYYCQVHTGITIRESEVESDL